MDVSKFNEMLRTCCDFIRLEYECKIVVDLIEFQARESSFSEMRNESIILGLCFNRVQHTISMRFRSKRKRQFLRNHREREKFARNQHRLLDCICNASHSLTRSIDRLHVTAGALSKMIVAKVGLA